MEEGGFFALIPKIVDRKRGNDPMCRAADVKTENRIAAEGRLNSEGRGGTGPLRSHVDPRTHDIIGAEDLE